MTEPSDAYWDELGVTWCAIEPNVSIIASRLEGRLRRQSRWMTAGVVIGLPLCLAGMLLGIATIGMGLFGAWNFITRGIALLAISAVLIFPLASLLQVRSRSTGRALAEMIDLAIHRAQNILTLVRAGLYACAIAAVFGLVGTMIRTHLGRAPKLSPIIPLVILGLTAFVLFLYRRQLREQMEKYRALRQALTVDVPA